MERIAIEAEHVSATVLPGAGARLHSLAAFGVEVLRTPDTPQAHEQDPFFWGSYHMAPWCNRLDTGPVEVAGQVVDLPSNFPDGTAIHGQVYLAPWTQVDTGLLRIEGGGNGWPWTYDLTLAIKATGASLRLDYTLTNTSGSPMPAGIGMHPWFRQPLRLRVPASQMFSDNTDTPPEPEPISEALDLRIMRPLPDKVDACWADLTSPTAEIMWPTHGIAMEMRAEADDEVVVVAANRLELEAAAVEQQTHAPAGLRRLLRGEPYAMRLLEPGTAMRLGLILSFRQFAE